MFHEDRNTNIYVNIAAPFSFIGAKTKLVRK